MNIRFNKPIRKMIIVTLVSSLIASALTIGSLNHMKYLAEEEATVEYFGFPFAMKETEPFSGGYFGNLVRERGEAYVFEVNNIDSNLDSKWLSVALSNNLETNWSGVVLNLASYLCSILFVFRALEKLSRKVRIARA